MHFAILNSLSGRDNFDTKKAVREQKISDLLETAWTIESNPNLVYVYAQAAGCEDRIGDFTGV